MKGSKGEEIEQEDLNLKALLTNDVHSTDSSFFLLFLLHGFGAALASGE